VRSYIDEVEHALSVIRVRDENLNVDETGLCSRPMKAKKKVIVYSMGCGTKAAHREETDLKHVSLVSTTDLLGQRLKMLYFIANKVAIKDPDSCLTSGNLTLYQTLKGYQNGDSMSSTSAEFWLHIVRTSRM
jgi:hypothetical protein